MVAAGATLFSIAANAQSYPSRPITIIVPFAAGSATDTVSRVVGQYLGSALNQSVVVENKPAPTARSRHCTSRARRRRRRS